MFLEVHSTLRHNVFVSIDVAVITVDRTIKRLRLLRRTVASERIFFDLLLGCNPIRNLKSTSSFEKIINLSNPCPTSRQNPKLFSLEKEKVNYYKMLFFQMISFTLTFFFSCSTIEINKEERKKERA